MKSMEICLPEMTSLMQNYGINGIYRKLKVYEIAITICSFQVLNEVLET